MEEEDYVQDWSVDQKDKTDAVTVSKGTHTIKNEGRGSVKVKVYDQDGNHVKSFTLNAGKSKTITLEKPGRIEFELKTGRSAKGTVTTKQGS